MKTYKFFGKKISGPFTIPSGIITTEASVLEKIANEIPEIGILTTKSIGLEPRQGNREPIIAQYSPFSFINAVGLTNPGAEEFARRLARIKIPDDKFLLISIFGSNENEFKEIAEKLFAYADGFEINISCPHSDKYGQVIGQDNILVEKIVRNVSSLGKPALVKISPNLDVREAVKCAIKAGASGITAINTKGPEMFLRDNHPVLTNKKGGVSGKAILELGLESVKQVREITSLPIIACGGISIAQDLKRYKLAGADFFGIGSALAGMKTQEIKEYFHKLLKDFEEGDNEAARFLKSKLNLEYKKCEIKENKQLAEDLFLLKLNNRIKTEPGQFIFAWLPEKGEKPFSVFDDEPLSLLIQIKGCFTNELAKLNKGDNLYIRGPYGNSPKIEGKILLVGGGTGIAGLYLFAKRNREAVVVLGAKDKKHLFYEKFEDLGRKIYLFTEKCPNRNDSEFQCPNRNDSEFYGEKWNKGLATDNLEKIIEKNKPEYCVNCGPEAMVITAVRKQSKYIVQENIYSSIEFLTKCGIGLCGSCATSRGDRSCVDGTFLT